MFKCSPAYGWGDSAWNKWYFFPRFRYFFFLVKTIPVAKNINICVWENKAKSWVELPIKNLGGISFWMLSWHSYAIAFNTFHPVFASVISIIAASTVHYYFSIRFVFFLVPLSHDDFFHYSVRFYNNDNNNKNEFLLLVPFTKVTFIKYTFRSFSRTMLDSLLFALGFITCIKSIIKKIAEVILDEIFGISHPLRRRYITFLATDAAFHLTRWRFFDRVME